MQYDNSIIDEKFRYQETPIYSNNILRFYTYLNEGANKYGDIISQNYGKVIEYGIKIGDKQETIIIDFKNKYK